MLLQEKDSTGQIRTRTNANSLRIKTQREYDLSGVAPQKNWRNTQSSLNLLSNNLTPKLNEKNNSKRFDKNNSLGEFKIYCYCFSAKLLETLNLNKYLDYSITTELNGAHLAIGPTKYLKKNKSFITEAKKRKIPTYSLDVINIQEMICLIKTMLYLNLRRME